MAICQEMSRCVPMRVQPLAEKIRSVALRASQREKLLVSEFCGDGTGDLDYEFRLGYRNRLSVSYSTGGSPETAVLSSLRESSHSEGGRSGLEQKT